MPLFLFPSTKKTGIKKTPASVAGAVYVTPEGLEPSTQ